MHEQMLKDILRRLNALERTSAKVRVGEVTATGPLDVALGGSATSYTDVAAIQPVASGDQIAALLWGNDLLVLGPVGATRPSAGPSGAITTTTTTMTAMTSGPSVTVPTAGSWLVRFGLDIQSQAAGLFQGNARIGLNGTAAGTRTLTFIGQATFDGASVFGEQALTLSAGDVLTVMVAGNNTVSTSYSNGTISIERA